MKIINLLPKEEQHQLKLDILNQQLKVFWIAVALSLVTFAIIGLAVQQYLSFSLKNVEQKVAQSQASLETSDIRALQEQVIQLNQNVSEIQNVRGQQYQWSVLMREIALIAPADIQLNTLELDRATGQVVLAGQARDRDTVIELWSRLKKNEMFYDVNFPLPNLEQPVNANFTYTFYVNLDQLKHDEL